MSSRVKRFGELERLAGSREQEASRRLAATLDALREKEQQLDQLRTYLDEYQQQSRAAQGTDPTRWENYRLFLSRLSEAIQQQERELTDARARYAEEASSWRESHARTQALTKLVDKYRREDRQRMTELEQKELDELLGNPRKP